MCSQPYGSQNWPSACSTATINFAFCAIANIPAGLGGALTLAGTVPIFQACNCLSQFWSSLGGCGVPGQGNLQQLVCASNWSKGICSCDGSGNINSVPANLVSQVKTTIASDYQAWLANHGGTKLVAQINAAHNYICSDRFLIDVISGNTTASQIASATAAYFGLPNTDKLIVGIGMQDLTGCPDVLPGGPSSGKRAEEQSSSYTVQVLPGSGTSSGLSSGAIAGIVIGVLLGVVVIAVVIVLIVTRSSTPGAGEDHYYREV